MCGSCVYVYHTVLLSHLLVEIPEPIYKIEKPRTAHQIRQDALRKKHSNSYRYMLL